jgi:hypothetical protein
MSCDLSSALWKACGIEDREKHGEGDDGGDAGRFLAFSASKILNSNQLYNSLPINTILAQ